MTSAGPQANNSARWTHAPATRRNADDLPRASVETLGATSSPAQVIERARARLGWPKGRMATMVGVTPDTYSRWLRPAGEPGAFAPPMGAVRLAMTLTALHRTCPGMLTGLLTVAEFDRKFEAIQGEALRLGAAVHLPAEMTPDVVRRLAVVVDGDGDGAAEDDAGDPGSAGGDDGGEHGDPG